MGVRMELLWSVSGRMGVQGVLRLVRIVCLVLLLKVVLMVSGGVVLEDGVVGGAPPDGRTMHRWW